MSLTAICLLESARRKFLMNSTYTMSRKQESKCFWAREAEISLTAINSLESTRIKFVINSTYIMSRKKESSVFGVGGRNESNSHQLARIGEKKIFHELDVHHVFQKVGIKRFLGSGGQNESNSHQLARIGEKIVFHELDVHHVQKVGSKRFGAQEAEMTLTVISLLESARRKFFMNSTYTMSSRKQESKGFWAREAEMSLTGINSLESARIKFFMNSTYIKSRKQESNVFGLRRPK